MYKPLWKSLEEADIVAGAQLKENSIEDAKVRVKAVLKEMIEKGEI